MSEGPRLNRTLTTGWVVLYGLGTTVGAGIYALTGKVAGEAGMAAPMAFLLASGLAAFSALSFCELSSRHPRSAGEATYVREAFGRQSLALVVGAAVVFSGSLSAATVANGFAGYLAELVTVPAGLSVAALILVMGILCALGVRISVGVAAAVTVIELLGLAVVLWVAGDSLRALPEKLPALIVPSGIARWSGVFAAATLAFYAFLGFEDMVNVAEEIRDVRRSLPRAIVVTLIVTSVLYVALASVCVLTVPPAELAQSEAPLAFVFERASGGSSAWISAVGALAMVNGALIQIIMASRVLYGLASDGGGPRLFARVHPRTRTPLFATATVTGLVLLLGLAFPLVELARATALITLAVFGAVNLALIALKRGSDANPEAVSVPLWVPVAGFGTTAGFLVLEALRAL